jgi:hypothetical protein
MDSLAFGPTGGHSEPDANVCRQSTRCATLMPVKYFAWDDAKNAKLKADRGIGFEDIVFHIERGDLLDILEPRRSRPSVRKAVLVKIATVSRSHRRTRTIYRVEGSRGESGRPCACSRPPRRSDLRRRP